MINEMILKIDQQSEQKEQTQKIIPKQQQFKSQKQNKILASSFQDKKVISMFSKNYTIKDKNLLKTISQAVTQIGQNNKPAFKIKPIQLINKIQQSRPQYKNSIVNKELAFDVLLQTQKTVKVKNCVSPLRPNSQIYKRLSKNFFENLKNGIDQCILFTGTEPGARVQSSIGNQNNPGIFMIVAIAILDEKYKNNHERFDAQFSFLQYRGDKMYDLINYTEEPLIPKMNDSKIHYNKVHNFQFGEHFVKVCTFLQFIKLFKIALFNNKERDIKTNKQKSVEQIKSEKTFQYTSSFIMKIRIKKYDIDSKLIFEQQTMLIDLDQNSSLRSNQHKKDEILNQGQKQLIKNQRRKSQVVGRTIHDFILIEINNSNPLNKPIHYHMVEKNLLLEVIKKYLRVKQSILPKNVHIQPQNSVNKFKQSKQQLKEYQVGGFLFVINSFTVNPFAYQKNMKLYQNLSSSVGEQWQAIVKVKNTQKKEINLAFVQTILNQIISTIKNQKYTSFKDLYAAKQFYIDESKKMISDIKLYRSLLFDYCNHKKALSYNKNLLTAYQLQLIGKCVKSDNFKQFYNSKSYLSLPRQIQIKTQKLKPLIKDQLHILKFTQEKFHLLRKKKHQNRKSLKVPEIVKNFSTIYEKQKQKHPIVLQRDQPYMQKTKFKIISRQQTFDSNQINDYQRFNELKKYVYDYFNELSHWVIFQEQRTITQQYIFEENFARHIRNLKQNFKIFIKQVQSIDEAKIKHFIDEPNNEIQNLNKLMRTVHLSKKNGLNSRSSKLLKNQLSSSLKNLKLKTENLSQQKIILPKIFEREKFDNIKQKSVSSNFNSKTIEKNTSNVIQVKGKVNFGSLLLNPKKLS